MKVSSAAAKQSRDFFQHKLTIAVDLGAGAAKDLVLREKQKADLTPTGLLMGGHCTQNP